MTLSNRYRKNLVVMNLFFEAMLSETVQQVPAYEFLDVICKFHEQVNY